MCKLRDLLSQCVPHRAGGWGHTCDAHLDRACLNTPFLFRRRFHAPLSQTCTVGEFSPTLASRGAQSECRAPTESAGIPKGLCPLTPRGCCTLALPVGELFPHAPDGGIISPHPHTIALSLFHAFVLSRKRAEKFRGRGYYTPTPAVARCYKHAVIRDIRQ